MEDERLVSEAVLLEISRRGSPALSALEDALTVQRVVDDEVITPAELVDALALLLHDGLIELVDSADDFTVRSADLGTAMTAMKSSKRVVITDEGREAVSGHGFG